MTPTEQDKELREQLQGISYKAVVSAYNTSQAGLIDYAHELTEELLQLITADRKRVALEARIDELERIDAANIGNGINFWFAHLKKQDSIENNNGWRTMRQYTPERIAELKAQQEELGDS